MLIVFDFDGTLGDTYTAFKAAFDDAAIALNTRTYRLADEQHIRSLDAAGVLRFHDVPQQRLGDFVAALKRGMASRKSQVKLFPGISRMLEHLSADDHKLGLISSNSADMVLSTLGPASSLFTYSELDVALSEKRASIRRAAATVTPDESIWYVGDEIRDCQAAQAADSRFLGVTWGYNTEASLAKAGCNLFARCPSDILSVVSAMK